MSAEQIVISDEGDNLLVVSGTGPDNTGWFFAVDDLATPGAYVEELDYLNSSGLAVVGKRFYRVLSAVAESGASGELLTYDEHGVVAYRRVDGLADPHGLVYDGQHLIVPCPADNVIYGLTLDGEVGWTWSAPGTGDAWHLNGVHVRDGRLYASAFGMFADHRGWGKALDERSGLIFDVRTRDVVVSNLSCPHDPMFLDGGWLVCDSRTKRLLHIDEASGQILHEIDLGGWTRGVAVGRDTIYVGVSGQRYADDDGDTSSVVAIDRSTWQVSRRFPLPCQEINSLCLVPRSFLGALRRGFRTNALRVSVQDRQDMFRLTGNIHPEAAVTPMDPLALHDYQIRVRAEVPQTVVADRLFDVPCEIRNHASTILFTAPPYPINIGYRWERLSDGTLMQLDERRKSLPAPLGPGETLALTLSIRSPEEPGTYRLTVTLVQEWIRWFDAEDTAQAAQQTITVLGHGARELATARF